MLATVISGLGSPWRPQAGGRQVKQDSNLLTLREEGLHLSSTPAKAIDAQQEFWLRGNSESAELKERSTYVPWPTGRCNALPPPRVQPERAASATSLMQPPYGVRVTSP